MPLLKDVIELKGMVFYGYHGLYQEEKNLGQPFKVDLRLFLSLLEAGENDEVEKTVDYSQVYQLVKSIVEGQPFKLLEALAHQLAQEILASFPPIQELQVKVEKTSPPIPGLLEGVRVLITRGRP